MATRMAKYRVTADCFVTMKKGEMKGVEQRETRVVVVDGEYSNIGIAFYNARDAIIRELESEGKEFIKGIGYANVDVVRPISIEKFDERNNIWRMVE
jgi:hypothetical protein